MTLDIHRRLKEHNWHLSNTLTTKSNTGYQLMFCQIVDNRSDARNLEKYLKSGSGREIRAEIVKSFNLGL
jgi:predicted GIY-YIG superfamily endonuclease